ncbi:MAG TPA: YciI family protein [Candidatus Dormibacteraeota bacterium]|nr:YciI family protein [Candidatus Dormibacteraeota bacterium]
MRYFMYTTPDPANPPPPPTPEMFEEMEKFIEESFRSGVLETTGALDPQVTRIENSKGAFTLTDGPFTEAKELVVGWAIINVPTKEEAIALSKRFWGIVGDGTGIIQRILEPGEQPGS